MNDNHGISNNHHRTVVMGTGMSMPENVISNKDLEKIVDTSDEWITQRTGIKERRIASNGQSTVTFGAEASRQALREANLSARELDMIIVATQTPDTFVPSTSCLLQKDLDAPQALAFDLVAGCTGFIYGLVVADNFIKNNPWLKILVVGAEQLSPYLNWEDRTTCIPFGDGAGAAVVTGSDNGGGVLATCLRSDGAKWNLLTILGGGTLYPPSHEMIDQKLSVIRMEGNKVFKLAVPAMEEVAWHVLTQAGYAPADVDVFIPHQANIRIMEAVGQRLGIPESKTVLTVHKYGNTSTASIPTAMAEANREGRIKKGDLVLMVAFGAGFTWGGVLMEW